MTPGEVYDRLMDDADACPCCGDTDGLDKIDEDGSSVLTLKMRCLTCGAEWWEEFRLQKAGLTKSPDKAVSNPAAHARDMNAALEKADAKARPWFTLAQFQGDDDGQPE